MSNPENEKIRYSDWTEARQHCGEVLRENARDGKLDRNQVIARTYTVSSARHYLLVQRSTVEAAVKNGLLKSFIDPEGRERISAQEVEDCAYNSETRAALMGLERIKLEDLALVCGIEETAMREKLKELGLSTKKPSWGDLQGRWGLPESLAEFKARLKNARARQRKQRRQEVAKRRRDRRQKRRDEKRERQRKLRKQLLEVFPEWQYEERQQQQIYLHVGAPNSGKTHDALEALVEAGSGWYLAPLRLLAFEIFDRLNAQGVLCNLLTGEEYIPIPGATITASTIEMFNPVESGECIIIDEAQMLADSDRGWAWTRAMMEAQAPEIHIIAPKTTQKLIENMANAATIPIEVVEHDRLTPIQVADKHWPLEELPPQTILIAFSRRMVLQLKTELERMKRSVSVVYGNLPPEVRRKQADRFASGETEICVATDAVGMGLNLPADYVCFYEVEKFDGKQIRRLTPAEVQQIGGRAGRFGLSQAGQVGATTKQNLRIVSKLFNAPAETLTHARIAPTVDDLELIPGNLAEKLAQWAKLQSIPDKLRNLLSTANMAERIELAKMLSDDQVALLGLADAATLINAPTRRTTRLYWMDCVRAILAGYAMPLPPMPAPSIENSADLEDVELAIAAADVYLWLARRREFSRYAPDEPEMRELRQEWSLQIDEALLRKLDAMPRCTYCGKSLPLNYRYKLCYDCYVNTYYAGDYSA